MKPAITLLLCAWVLWAVTPKGLMAPAGGYESKSECESARPELRERAGKESIYMMCLPDTVDPRK